MVFLIGIKYYAEDFVQYTYFNTRTHKFEVSSKLLRCSNVSNELKGYGFDINSINSKYARPNTYFIVEEFLGHNNKVMAYGVVDLFNKAYQVRTVVDLINECEQLNHRVVINYILYKSGGLRRGVGGRVDKKPSEELQECCKCLDSYKQMFVGIFIELLKSTGFQKGYSKRESFLSEDGIVVTLESEIWFYKSCILRLSYENLTEPLVKHNSFIYYQCQGVLKFDSVNDNLKGTLFINEACCPCYDNFLKLFSRIEDRLFDKLSLPYTGYQVSKSLLSSIITAGQYNAIKDSRLFTTSALLFFIDNYELFSSDLQKIVQDYYISYENYISLDKVSFEQERGTTRFDYEIQLVKIKNLIGVSDKYEKSQN